MKDTHLFPYSDNVSKLILWQKAFCLMPIWGAVAVPVAGGIFSLFGNFGIQLGYTFTLMALLAYFVEDILKTKIRIEAGRLWHGFRIFDLSKLATVGLEYKPEQMVPRKIVLNFTDGKRYMLKISRLRQSDIESLMKLIESRYPATKIEPVLRTLSKCKRLAGTTALDTAEKVEIPYNSRLMIKQLHGAFLNTANSWLQAGPAIVSVLFMMFWLPMFTGFFSTLSIQGYAKTANDIATQKQMEHMFQQSLTDFFSGVNSTSGHVVDFLAMPVVSSVLVVLLVAFSTFLVRYLGRPTTLMLDGKTLSLFLRLGNVSIPVGGNDWSKISHAYLQNKGSSADLERAKIIFAGTDGKPILKLNLTSIATDNRIRLLKALERLAPDCTIDPTLSEALMPRQERSYTELWLQSLAAPPERKSLEPLAPGQLLQDERFEVIKRLGVGGQGQAYLCKDRLRSEEPQVVLKETILPLYVENVVRQQALERFQQEAELLNQLESERIVHLNEYFIEDHRGYLVLEHIEGKTLRQVVEEQGAVDETQARDLAVQMAAILTYLHEHGIIHRDFTPDNLILRHTGKLTLIDFNVAQLAETGSSGTIVGKHAFVPPEQFRGKPTFHSDIYAMGATLHFLLTGRDPEPISQSRPQSIVSDMSEQFSDMVAQCTQLQANKRFQSAVEAHQAFLSLYMEDEPQVIKVAHKETATS